MQHAVERGAVPRAKAEKRAAAWEKKAAAREALKRKRADNAPTFVICLGIHFPRVYDCGQLI